MKSIDAHRILSTLLFSLLLSLFCVSCNEAKEKDLVSQEIWRVAPETVKEEKMQVTTETGEHYVLPLNAIERFEYERGYSYTLSVLVDAQARKEYSRSGVLRAILVKIISKVPQNKDSNNN